MMRADDHNPRPQASRHMVDVIELGVSTGRSVPSEELLTVQITVRRENTVSHQEGHLSPIYVYDTCFEFYTAAKRNGHFGHHVPFHHFQEPTGVIQGSQS